MQWLSQIGDLLPNNQRQRRTCYALCRTLYPVSAEDGREVRTVAEEARRWGVFSIWMSSPQTVNGVIKLLMYSPQTWNGVIKLSALNSNAGW